MKRNFHLNQSRKGTFSNFYQRHTLFFQFFVLEEASPAIQLTRQQIAFISASILLLQTRLIQVLNEREERRKRASKEKGHTAGDYDTIRQTTILTILCVPKEVSFQCTVLQQGRIEHWCITIVAIIIHCIDYRLSTTNYYFNFSLIDVIFLFSAQS